MSNFASWLSDFSNNISPMDVDFLLHDAHGVHGPRFLLLEFKAGEPLPVGQSWALRNLARRAGVEVLLVDETHFHEELIGVSLPPRFDTWTSLSPTDLDQMMHRWLESKVSMTDQLAPLLRAVVINGNGA